MVFDTKWKKKKSVLKTGPIIHPSPIISHKFSVILFLTAPYSLPFHYALLPAIAVNMIYQRCSVMKSSHCESWLVDDHPADKVGGGNNLKAKSFCLFTFSGAHFYNERRCISAKHKGHVANPPYKISGIRHENLSAQEARGIMYGPNSKSRSQEDDFLAFFCFLCLCFLSWNIIYGWSHLMQKQSRFQWK